MITVLMYASKRNNFKIVTDEFVKKSLMDSLGLKHASYEFYSCSKGCFMYRG